MDLLIHPFQRYEGETFCLANIEALAKGTFVLSPAVGGMHDYLHTIQERVDAYFLGLGEATLDVTITNTDPRAIASQAHNLLTSGHLEAIKEISRQFVTETFTLKKQVASYLQLYNEK